MRRIHRNAPAGFLLEPRERARTAAACVLNLLRDLLDVARNLDRLAGHETQHGPGHLEPTHARVVAERARDLSRVGLPLEQRLLLVPANRVPVYRILERLQLGLEPVDAPMEACDRSVIA